MLSSHDGCPDTTDKVDSGPSPPPPPSEPAATLTCSDLVKGGETPVLLASDTLGRVGLLRYPAQLPPEPTPPTAAPVPAPPVGGEEGADADAQPPAGPGPTPEEAEAALAAATTALAEAVDAAVPRVRGWVKRRRCCSRFVW